LIILCVLLKFEATAQTKFANDKEVPSLTYDEIPVLVIVEGYRNFYIDIIYTNNELLYINIEDLFKALSISCVFGQKGDSLTGFIENESRTYLIDYNTKQIKVGDKIINTKNGLVKEMGSLYMESSLFAEAFGITLTFNYRALSIILKSDFELPVIKLQRIEKMRNNVSKLKGELIADTIVHRDYHLFKIGMADWSVISSQKWNEQTENSFGLGIGTELLYGEANVSVNYYDRYKFDNRQLQYLWRWVDNDKNIIKQAQIGKIPTQSISFIDAPVIGAVVRNAPTTVRKATGYYTINEHTEPNWTVELYINNVLVDYTKADASGLFVFKVPIVYGYTTLKLKFYGPMGEERTEERTMNIPYTIMAKNEFEYGLSAGIVQDSSSSRFGKAEFNYGVNRILTVGGGLEYLSSITTGASIPYAEATIQPFSKLIISGEYADGVKTSGILNYYFKRNAFLEIDYAKFVEGQRATIFNASEERKAKLSIPFKLNKLYGYARLDYSQFFYSEFKYNQANLMLSAYYKQFSANSSTQLNRINRLSTYLTSDLAISYRLNNGFLLRPSAQYNISEGRLVMYKAELEKHIPKVYLSVSYQKNILFNGNYINVNLRYDLTFAKTSISASRVDGNILTSEAAHGSLAFGGGNKYVYVSNNTSVGKGGIALYPFLDLNNNGIFDKGEHFVKLNSVKALNGKAIVSEKDSIVRITDLNAFTNYLVEFNNNDLDNIAWRFKNKIYKVLIDPNQFKRIDIPIIAVGEVSGTTFMNKDNALKGIGRITVKFYKKNSNKVVAETLSETDGYISCLGFEPGEYVARVDSVQLKNLDFSVDLPQKDFTIKTLEEGDVVEGIDFVLSYKKEKEKSKIDTSIIKDIQIKTDSLTTRILNVDTISKKPVNEKADSTNINKVKEAPPINTSIIKATQIRTDSLNRKVQKVDTISKKPVNEKADSTNINKVEETPPINTLIIKATQIRTDSLNRKVQKVDTISKKPVNEKADSTNINKVKETPPINTSTIKATQIRTDSFNRKVQKVDTISKKPVNEKADSIKINKVNETQKIETSIIEKDTKLKNDSLIKKVQKTDTLSELPVYVKTDNLNTIEKHPINATIIERTQIRVDSLTQNIQKIDTIQNLSVKKKRNNINNNIVKVKKTSEIETSIIKKDSANINRVKENQNKKAMIPNEKVTRSVIKAPEAISYNKPLSSIIEAYYPSVKEDVHILQSKHNYSKETLKSKMKEANTPSEHEKWKLIYLISSNSVNVEYLSGITGYSKATIYSIVPQFSSKTTDTGVKSKDVVQPEKVTIQNEAEFMKTLKNKVLNGQIVSFRDLKNAVEAKVGKEVSRDYIWDLLKRYGWTKYILNDYKMSFFKSGSRQ